MSDSAVYVVIQNKLSQLVTIGLIGADGSTTEAKRLMVGASTEPLPLARVSSHTHHLAHLGYITIRAV